MGPTVSLRALNRATLARQGLLERQRGPVADVIGRLAGLQAQHANAPYVALWSRRAGQTIHALERALDDRSVVKATVMRSTLHLVAAVDYPAYDRATAQARSANWRATARRAGVDLEDLHAKLVRYCREPRSVAEIEAWIEKAAPGLGSAAPAGVRNTGFRAAAAGGGLVHVPPSGMWRSHDKPRYVAADRWLRTSKVPSTDEALRTAVERYLGAYGPASIADIAKWLGQPRIPLVRAAVDAFGERLVRTRGDDGRELVDLDGSPSPEPDRAAPPRFLARWDSALIAYDVRSRILPDVHTARVIKANGDFLPTFLVDGFVAGLWSIDVERGRAVLRLEAVGRVPKTERAALEEEADAFARYQEPDADHYELRWSS